MGYFSCNLHATYNEERDVWVIEDELTYFTALLPEKHVTVPIGFETDLASVPRFFWRIFPKSGRWNRAAVVHDYLYKTGMVSRSIADSIFLEAMGILEVGAISRYVMWAAVRSFGWCPWKKCRRLDILRT